ncbi:MAG: glycosyltransferase family 87 protein [Vulcanimicrobiaceae bacterium]
MRFTRRSALLVLAALCVATALLFVRPHATPGPVMRDFESYYAAGATWLRGADPYSAAIWQAERSVPGVDASRYELLPFVGPPAFLPLWSLVARLPFAAAAALWGIVLAAALALVIVTALRLADTRVTVVALLATLVVAVGFGPITSDIALGQVALPAFASALLACSVLGRRPIAAALASFFAAAQPNVSLVLLSQAGRRRAVFAFAIAAAAFAAASLYACGPHALTGYVALLAAHGGAERFSAIQVTPGAIAYGFGAPASLAQFVGVAAAVIAVVLWIVYSLRVRDDGARLAFTCAILPFAVPFFHEHDLSIAFVPAVYAVMRSDRRLVPVALCGALLVAIDWLGIAQRPDGVTQSFLLAAGAFAAYAALRDDLPWRSFALPAVPLGIALLAGFAASMHPAPIWPDAMHVFRPIAGESVSNTWAAEQRASGLLDPNAFWALLRCGSLAGCALLAFVSLRCSRTRRARGGS